MLPILQETFLHALMISGFVFVMVLVIDAAMLHLLQVLRSLLRKGPPDFFIKNRVFQPFFRP